MPEHPAPSRALYVEDNATNILLVEQVVAMHPAVELVIATNADEGIRLASAHSPGLVLLDLHLPGGSGEEVLRHLRSDPATSRCRVVMLTADARPGQAERLIAAGADDFVTKPVDITRLLEILSETFPIEVAA